MTFGELPYETQHQPMSQCVTYLGWVSTDLLEMLVRKMFLNIFEQTPFHQCVYGTLT